MAAMMVFVVFLVGIALSIPIGVSMILGSVAPIMLLGKGGTIVQVLNNTFSGANSTPILAVPLFILGGVIMAEGGISKKLFNFFAYFVGRIPGGVPCAVIMTCLFYGAISGSGPATTAAVGAMCIPFMVSLGYDKVWSAGLISVAGGLGVIIPPSIPFVLYSLATGVSTGALFLAGIIPGILIGGFCGTLAMIVAGPVWGSICGKKYFIPVPDHVMNQEEFDESKLPKFGTIVGIILIPLVLIIMKSVFSVLPATESIRPIFNFLGEPFVALLISTIFAMIILGLNHGYTMPELEKIMTKSLEPTGLILLVTACGGVLRYVLQYSGIGDLIGNAVGKAHLPIVVVAFIVAALVRICVGSATVAMTMAAGIGAAMPAIQGLSPLYLACVVAAVAGGSTVCSHFNDSGFWLVKSLVGMDETTTLKTWTIMETLVGLSGFIVALIISLFLG